MLGMECFRTAVRFRPLPPFKPLIYQGFFYSWCALSYIVRIAVRIRLWHYLGRRALRAVALPCAPFSDMAAFTWFAREVARQTQPDRIGAGHDADEGHAALRLPGERRIVPRVSRW